MFDSYRSIFARRGQSYDLAMRLCPAARATEFRHLIEALDPSPGQRILDLPAGGGYLRHWLPAEICYVGQDASHTFARASSFQGVPEAVCASSASLPFRDHSFDRIASLAGLHHELDLDAVLNECFRVLRPGGYLAIGEVEAGTRTANFLNGFVDLYNPEGHKGLFLDHTTSERIRVAGFVIESDTCRRCDWHFPSQVTMTVFLRYLFGLQCSDAVLLDALVQSPGLESAKSHVALRWELRYLRLSKPASLIAHQGCAKTTP